MHKLKAFLIISTAAIFFYASCGGSGGTQDTPDDPAEDPISNVSEIPLAVLAPIDYDPVGVDSSRSSPVKAKPGESGGFSRAGCEAIEFRNMAFQIGAEAKSVQCFMHKLAVAADLGISEGEYQYYDFGNIEVAEGMPMRIKTAIKSDGEDAIMLSCLNDKKRVELKIRKNGSGYRGHVIRVANQEENENDVLSMKVNFDVDGLPDNFSQADFDLEYSSIDNASGNARASISSRVGSSEISGFKKLTGTRTAFNKNTSIFAAYDDSEGSAKISISGYTPAVNVGLLNEQRLERVLEELPALDPIVGAFCVNDDGEFSESDFSAEFGEATPCQVGNRRESTSFSLQAGRTLKISNGAFLSDVEDRTLDTSDEEPVVEFSNSDFEDCSGDFIDLSDTVSGYDFSECLALTELASELNLDSEEDECSFMEMVEWIDN